MPVGFYDFVVDFCLVVDVRGRASRLSAVLTYNLSMGRVPLSSRVRPIGCLQRRFSLLQSLVGMSSSDRDLSHEIVVQIH